MAFRTFSTALRTIAVSSTVIPGHVPSQAMCQRSAVPSAHSATLQKITHPVVPAQKIRTVGGAMRGLNVWRGQPVGLILSIAVSQQIGVMDLTVAALRRPSKSSQLSYVTIILNNIYANVVPISMHL